MAIFNGKPCIFSEKNKIHANREMPEKRKAGIKH